MKKLLSLGLASAMVLSMGAAVSAANDDALFPVGSISESAYLYDDDKTAVDLSSAVESVPYGEVLYYPLLNTGAGASAEAVEAARALLAEKQALLAAAAEAHNNAVSDAAAKAEALENAAAAKQKAEAVLEAANAWNNDSENAELKAAYAAALAAFDSEAVASETAAEAVSAATGIASDANGAFDAAQSASNDANALVTSTEGSKGEAQTAVNEAQAALDALLSSDSSFVYESDAVSGIKIKQKWDMNGKYVDGVEIAKKKVTGASIPHKYIYFVAVSLKDTGSTTSIDIAGTIELRKSGSFDYEDMQLDVNMEISYDIADSTEITEDIQLFKEGYGFSGEDDEEFTFECDEDSYFEVNTIGQSKLLLSATSDFDSDIAELYPNANLNFFYGNGGTFNKTGTLYLSADEGSFLYQLKDDGSMVKVNAEYDEYDENFVIKTKTLGKYIISDTELTIVNKPVSGGSSNNNSGSVNNGSSNPATGAAL